MARLLSKKKLFAALQAMGLAAFADVVEHGLQHNRIGDETYGPKSMIYVTLADAAERARVERKLADAGFKVNRGYWKGSATTEVQVSYFKGHHWNE